MATGATAPAGAPAQAGPGPGAHGALLQALQALYFSPDREVRPPAPRAPRPRPKRGRLLLDGSQPTP